MWHHICWYYFKVETLSTVEKFLQDHYSLCERLSTETSRVSGSPAWWQCCRSVWAAAKGSWSPSGKHFEGSLQRALSIKYFRCIMWRRTIQMPLPHTSLQSHLANIYPVHVCFYLTKQVELLHRQVLCQSTSQDCYPCYCGRWPYRWM